MKHPSRETEDNKFSQFFKSLLLNTLHVRLLGDLARMLM